jgi:hypothetical protein
MIGLLDGRCHDIIIIIMMMMHIMSFINMTQSVPSFHGRDEVSDTL